MEIEKFYSVEYSSLQIAYAVKLNDTLIETNRFHDLPSKFMKTNQWMLNGKNTFEVNLSVNPRWELDLEENNFKIKFVQHEGTNGTYIPQELISHEWKYEPGTQFPIVIRGDFEIDIPFGNWAWLDAEILDEDTIDMESLKNYVTAIFNYLNNKDFAMLEPILITKATELAQAYYIDINQRFSDQKDFFLGELFSNPGWGMINPDLENLIFRFHAGNKLVEVLDKFGKSPLRSNSLGGFTYSLELFLCHKNNQWILCR
jgi:hypothetical protein